jgi:hypothetical protein
MVPGWSNRQSIMPWKYELTSFMVSPENPSRASIRPKRFPTLSIGRLCMLGYRHLRSRGGIVIFDSQFKVEKSRHFAPRPFLSYFVAHKFKLRILPISRVRSKEPRPRVQSFVFFTGLLFSQGASFLLPCEIQPCWAEGPSDFRLE